MRSADSSRSGVSARALVTISLALGLAACGAAGSGGGIASASALPDNGPQADYPILVGELYEVAGTSYTPADVLNYDEVGYVTLENGTTGYTGAHHTLPVPSYAEVTSLETGRTILVRLERRGPMDSNHLIALSPAAMAQLGGNVETPVRVRRVNPPEVQRAMLRGGNAAPLRMDTPMSLVNVLRRRLPESGSASLAANAGPPQAIETVEVEASAAMPATANPPAVEEDGDAQPVELAVADALDGAPTVEDAPAETFGAAFDGEAEDATAALAIDTARVDPAPALSAEADEQEVEAGFIVQAAAFSNFDNAQRAADALGAEISESGRYYRVRTGPFATRGEAEASLANVRRAGYSDARILTSG